MYSKPTDGVDGDTLLVAPGPEETFPSDWSPDGRTLVFERRSEKTGWDVWTVPVGSGGGTPSPLIQTDANERSAQISPDGKWIAYVANTSGREEVARPSSPPAARHQVSSPAAGKSDGGRWARVVYLVPESRQLVAIPAQLGADRTIALAPHGALRHEHRHVLQVAQPEYIPPADGQRFLIDPILQDPRPDAAASGAGSAPSASPRPPPACRCLHRLRPHGRSAPAFTAPRCSTHARPLPEQTTGDNDERQD